MSTTCEVPFEPLALDGSNYSSWCSNILLALKVLGPTAESIMVASILPKDETCVSPMNAASNTLLQLTIQVGQAHVATGVPLDLGTNTQPSDLRTQ
jgi:hypothetical protein